jgi:hypothetical protein
METLLIICAAAVALLVMALIIKGQEIASSKNRPQLTPAEEAQFELIPPPLYTDVLVESDQGSERLIAEVCYAPSPNQIRTQTN